MALIRNTSLAGSVDSEITDGAAPGTHGLTGRRLSVQEEDNIRMSPPPTTRERLRSIASGVSGDDSRRASIAGSVASTASAPKRTSLLSDRPRSSADADSTASAAPRNQSDTNGLAKLSAAQRYSINAEARKQSVVAASGTAPPPASTSTNSILVQSPDDPNQLVAAPPTATSESANKAQQTPRTGSKAGIISSSAHERRVKSIHALYGEPSIRIQLGTEMTLHCRMKLPSSWRPDQEVRVKVMEVSRPDDPGEFLNKGSNNIPAILGEAGAELLAQDDEKRLVRSKTHTLAKQKNVYRIVWGMVQGSNPPRSWPKFMLQAERVMEIRSNIRGDGKEECVLEDWECQKGVLAGKVKKRYEVYLGERFAEWGKGVKG